MRSTTNWSRPSAAKNPRKPHWIRPLNAATGCCVNSSGPTRTGSCAKTRPHRIQGCLRPDRLLVGPTDVAGLSHTTMLHSLPAVQDIAAFQAWRADTSQCLAAALDIARSHGLPHADPHLFSTGTNLVVALDDGLILKLFPPLLRSQFVSEGLSLSLLHGRLGVPIAE